MTKNSIRELVRAIRSRPYKKLVLGEVEGNDQAPVEQKNWSVVRRLIGYERYEADEALALPWAICQELTLSLCDHTAL